VTSAMPGQAQRVRAAEPTTSELTAWPFGDQAASDGERELAASRSFPRTPHHRLLSPLVVTSCVLVSIAIYRMAVIAAHGEPSGLDFGNWLMFGYQALGHPLTRAARVTYPPIVPLLCVAATKAFGVTWGTAALAGIASTAPATGVYFGCRLFGARWSAVLAAVLLAATSSSGEAAAWGGVPQLIGLGLTAAVLAVCQQTLLRPRWQRAAGLGLLLLALGATSHLVLAQAGAALVVLVLIGVVLRPNSFALGNWLGKNGWLSLSFLTLAPMAVLVPLYVRLVPTVGSSFVSQGSTANASPPIEFLGAMSVVYRDGPWLWKPALILTAVSPLILMSRKYRNRPLWSVLAALDLSLLAAGILSGQDRLVYVAPIAVAFAMVLWLSLLSGGNRRRYKRDATIGPMPLSTAGVVRALAVVAVVAVSVRGLAFFPTQRAFYGANQPPGTLAGLDWIRQHTPNNALIAVAPENGAPFGWWVQGYARRAALVGSEDQWLNFPDERSRAQQVVTLLSEPDPLVPVVFARARQLHVQYLLLPWAWGGLLPADLTAYRDRHPRSVVFDNEAMVMIQVPGSPVPNHGS
jgi:hypothetical protein